MIRLRYGGIKQTARTSSVLEPGFSCSAKNKKASGAEKPHPMHAGKRLLIEGLPVF
jgi:hypothetical protein